MSNTTERLIDTFVAKLRASGVPVIEHDNARQVQELEAKLPRRLPQSFGSLLSRYSFPAFDCSGISFFGWNAEKSDVDKQAAAAKGSLAEVLLPAGFVQIGRPDTGVFDAVCFDCNRQMQNREWRVVLVDHEEILCNHRIKVTRELWPSFRRVAENAAEGPARSS